LKIKLKDRVFDTNEMNDIESLAVLSTLLEQDFQNAFKNWQKTGNGAYALKGTNFECDGGQ
jgi:hypothetical protein